MTCIAALKHNGKIVLAGDRRMSWGMHKCQMKPTSKVVKKNGILIAGTGACYILTLVRDILKFPIITKREDTLNYIHNKFVPVLINLLKTKGMIKNGMLNVPKELHTAIIVAIKGNLFEIDIGNCEDVGIVAVDEVGLPYATGCGGQLAWGSLLTTEDSKKSPQERLKIALNVAAAVSPGCDGNIDIVEED